MRRVRTGFVTLGIAFGFLGHVAGVLAFWRTRQLNALDEVVVVADVYVGVVIRHREWLLRVVAPVFGLLVSARGWAVREEFPVRVPLRLLKLSWGMIAVGVALTFAHGSGLPESDGWFGFAPAEGPTYTPESKDALPSIFWIWGGRFVVAGVVVLVAALGADGMARRHRLVKAVSVASALVVASFIVAQGLWDPFALNPYVYLFIGLSSGVAAVCLHMNQRVSSRRSRSSGAPSDSNAAP